MDDRFVFTGMTDRVPQYLRLMDIFVLPSYREGFPVAILEAMSTGLPVVTTNVRGCREAVVEGENGFVVQPGNSQSLADAVGRLLREPELRHRMGADGRRIVVDKYDINRVRSNFVTFVQRIHTECGPAAAPVSAS